MRRTRSKRGAWLAPAFAAIALATAAPCVSEAAPVSGALRCAPQEIGTSQPVGTPPSPLERARHDCPLLGAIIEEYAMQDLSTSRP